MDKKKKKQLSFLYINPTKITPKEYRESISSGADIEVTGILKEDALAEMAASDIDNVPFEPSVKPAQDDQTIVPPREYGLLNNIIVNELEKTSLVHNFFHILLFFLLGFMMIFNSLFNDLINIYILNVCLLLIENFHDTMQENLIVIDIEFFLFFFLSHKTLYH